MRGQRHASIMPSRLLRLDLALDADDDLEILRGALLAAKATELGEAHRRGARLSFGYGSDSARDVMNAEVAQARRRADLLDRLIEALSGSERTPER
jgi:hypothetical protein